MGSGFAPVVIGVLADLSGAKERALRPSVADRRFARVASSSLPAFFRHVSPVVAVGPTLISVSSFDELFSDAFFAAFIDDNGATALRQATGGKTEGGLSQLRSTWEGIRFLVDALADREDLIIEVLDVSQAELAKTLKRYKGTPWNQSPIFVGPSLEVVRARRFATHPFASRRLERGSSADCGAGTMERRRAGSQETEAACAARRRAQRPAGRASRRRGAHRPLAIASDACRPGHRSGSRHGDRRAGRPRQRAGLRVHPGRSASLGR